MEKNRYKKTHWISWIATLSQRNYIYILPKKANSLSPKRILLTTSVTVALTMSQERLSGLTIVSTKKEMLVTLEYNNLINNFTSQKAIKKI